MNLKDYQKAQESFTLLHEKIKKVTEKRDKTANSIFLDYRDRIYNLEYEKNKTIKEVETLHNTEIEDIKTQLLEPMKIIKQFKHLMNLFLTIQSNESLEIPEVYKYVKKDKVDYQPIEVIIQDQYKYIALYITDNKKPTNKYSLIVVGNTILSKAMNLTISYGLNALTQKDNIRYLIKDFPTIKAINTYLSKNKTKIVQQALEGFDTVEKEYKEAQVLFEQKEWKEAFLLHQKKYYETQYNRGTETPEYKDIIKQLQKLRRN